VLNLLLGRGGLWLLAAVSDLITLLLFTAIALVDFLSNYGICASVLICGGFFSASHSFTILYKGLSFGRRRARAAHRWKAGELWWESTSTEITEISRTASTEEASWQAAEASAKSTTEAATAEEVISTSEEIIGVLLLLLSWSSSLTILLIHLWHLSEIAEPSMHESSMHKIIVLIEERWERISSSKELSENLVSMAECKARSTSESLETSELWASSAATLRDVLSISVIVSSLLLIREYFISLPDPLKYFLSLLFHGFILMFIRVPLDRQLTISLLDLVIVAGARQTKDLVVVVTVELFVDRLFIHSVKYLFYNYKYSFLPL